MGGGRGVGLTIIASAPLSWGTGRRLRPLPAGRDLTARDHLAGPHWAGSLPSVLLGGLGVLAGTVVDMTDPQTSLGALLPGWFYPVFLLVIVVGSITNNVLTAYSSGLALQAVGIPWSRPSRSSSTRIVGVAITCYALFLSNFLDTLNNILALSVALLGAEPDDLRVPTSCCAATATTARDLHDETPGQPRSGSRAASTRPASSRQVVGTAVAVLCMDTTSGRRAGRAQPLDGADLSALAGPVLAGVIYAAMATRQRRATPDRATPDRATPDRATPDRVTPDRATPDPRRPSPPHRSRPADVGPPGRPPAASARSSTAAAPILAAEAAKS